MERAGRVYFGEAFAGIIRESENGFEFMYDRAYLRSDKPQPISLTMPLREEPYASRTMIPFFDGLIPEGWLLQIIHEDWKFDARDRMGLLLAVCRDCIGAVSVIEMREGRE